MEYGERERLGVNRGASAMRTTLVGLGGKATVDSCGAKIKLLSETSDLSWLSA